MSAIPTIVGYGLREALRRKVFAVVLFLTLGFLGLYWLANHYVFRDVQNVGPPPGVDARTFAGAFMFGLAMFATLFLGVVLAVFLTLGVVRGDAERGLLQPLIVRPIGRPTLLFARWLGAVAICAPYVGAVYVSAMVITGLTGHWWPDRLFLPGLELAAGVAIVAALSLLGSVFLTSTANGIAILMVFGAGLVAGLLGSIGHGAQLAHARARRQGRGLADPVRSALPGRAAADHGEHDRVHGLPAPARPVRRRLHGRNLAAALGDRLSRARGSRSRGRLRSQGPLTHQEGFLRLRAKAARCLRASERSLTSCFIARCRSSRCSSW